MTTEQPFRIQFVPGVMPDRWLRTWERRMPSIPLVAEPVALARQLDGLRTPPVAGPETGPETRSDTEADTEADTGTDTGTGGGPVSMCFVRLPVDRAGLHVIPLYREVPVVVVSAEHPVAAFEEVDVADLADEQLLQDPDDVPEWRDAADPARVAQTRDVLGPDGLTTEQAVAVAAAGTGIVIVPLSVARLLHRKDVVHRPVTGVAESPVGLAWRVDDEDPRIETFIGIVRGRTEASSRTPRASSAPPIDRRARQPVRRGRRGR